MTIKVSVTGKDDYGDYVCALIAGPPGKGKTRFSVTAENPLLLNAEAGTMSIAELGIPKVEIDSSDSLLATRYLLSLGTEAVEEAIGHPVGTIILDSIDEIQRIIIGERLEAVGKDSLGPGDWTWLNDQMNAIVRGFRSLPYHVIFCCHVKDTTDGETGRVNYKLDMSGAIAHQLPAAVDIAALLTDRSVAVVDDDGVTHEERRSFLFTQPMDRYDWLKDRSGTLEAVIELNFDNDFVELVERVNSREVIEHEIRLVEVEGMSNGPDESGIAKIAGEVHVVQAPTPRQQVNEAASMISAAETDHAEKAGDVVKRSKLTEVSNGNENSVDLDSYTSGEGITLEGDIPLGYKLGNSERVMQVRGYRTVYEIANGEKILSVNELQKGVLPIPNKEIKSGIFCQESGEEVTADDSNLSRIRFRKILSSDIFDEEVSRLKR